MEKKTDKEKLAILKFLRKLEVIMSYVQIQQKYAY